MFTPLLRYGVLRALRNKISYGVDDKNKPSIWCTPYDTVLGGAPPQNIDLWFRGSNIPEFCSYVPNFKIRVLSLCLENQYTIVGGNDIRGDGHMTNRWYWGEWQITLEGTDSWHKGGRTAGIRSNGQLILGGRTAYIRGDRQPTLGGTDSLH